jgi:hypothetical protein
MQGVDYAYPHPLSAFTVCFPGSTALSYVSARFSAHFQKPVEVLL